VLLVPVEALSELILPPLFMDDVSEPVVVPPLFNEEVSEPVVPVLPVFDPSELVVVVFTESVLVLLSVVLSLQATNEPAIAKTANSFFMINL
jgi:hypothetical protein